MGHIGADGILRVCSCRVVLSAKSFLSMTNRRSTAAAVDEQLSDVAASGSARSLCARHRPRVLPQKSAYLADETRPGGIARQQDVWLRLSSAMNLARGMRLAISRPCSKGTAASSLQCSTSVGPGMPSGTSPARGLLDQWQLHPGNGRTAVAILTRSEAARHSTAKVPLQPAPVVHAATLLFSGIDQPACLLRHGTRATVWRRMSWQPCDDPVSSSPRSRRNSGGLGTL